MRNSRPRVGLVLRGGCFFWSGCPAAGLWRGGFVVRDRCVWVRVVIFVCHKRRVSGCRTCCNAHLEEGRPESLDSLHGPDQIRTVDGMNWRGFLGELQRRNVYRVAVTYTVVSWVLIQIATQVFPFFDIPNWAVRVVILLLALGFPVALILAWAFEITPEGIKRTEEVPPQESIRHHTGRKLLAVAAVAAAIAAGLFIVQGTRRSSANSRQDSSTLLPTQAVSEKSVAVLPFNNLSAEQENRFNPGRLVALASELDSCRNRRRTLSLRELETEACGAWISSRWKRTAVWIETVTGSLVAVFGLLNCFVPFAALRTAGLLRIERPAENPRRWLKRAGIVLTIFAAQVLVCDWLWGRSVAGVYALGVPVAGLYLEVEGV